MANTEAGGLFLKDSVTRVPLTGVAIEVIGSGAAAKVAVRQRYLNAEAVPIEAVYSFPLEEGSAVSELIVETGGRKLVGKIAEREKAFEQYDEAMAAGNGAFLADQDRQDEWRLLADKANRWLARQPIALPASATDWPAWAAAALGL